MMPTNVAARMTLAADPGSLQGAVAAGILGAGPVVLGTAEECARLLGSADARDPLEIAREIHAAGGKVPGFGHPVHKPLDPRAERILELADERGVSGPHVARARALPRRRRRGLGQAADDERLDADRRRAARPRLPADRRRRRCRSSRAPRACSPTWPRSRSEPLGFGLAAAAEEAVEYERRCSSLRSRPAPGTEQLALDDASFREQLAYLLERSAFYREKLAGCDGGRPRRDRAAAADREGASSGRRARPTTRSARTSAPSRDEIVRIYSTSGTTGTPSYIPLTAGDLDNWVTGSARSYAASGVARRAAHRLDLQRRAVRRPARRSPRSTASASATSRSAPGTPSGSLRAIELLRPEAVVLTPSYAALPVESASAASTSAARASSACSSPGEPGGGEPAFRAKLEEGWGARVTEAMGIGDIGVSLWGECEEQDGMHLGARGFVHAELIDPETGAPLDARRTAPRASSCSRTSATARRRCCASARATTSRVRTSPCPCGRTGPRIRCIGRTDDMLIVRGVNVFPSAIREVVGAFAPERQRPHPRPAAGAGREAGAAAAGGRRARARRDGRRRARRGDP